MNVRDDGAVVLQEAIEQGGFTHIGLTDDGYRNALLEGIAHFERVGELSDVFVNFIRNGG